MGTPDAILPVGRVKTPPMVTMEIPPPHKENPALALDYREETKNKTLER